MVTSAKLQIKTIVYLTCLAVSSIAVVVPALLALIVSKLKFRRAVKNVADKRKVLVTGAPHTKGLEICRVLSSAGHEVILADQKKFRWSAARFSNCVSKWFTLPNLNQDSGDDYRSSLIKLLEEEKVDWWIPVSHTCSAVPDTEVRVHLQNTNSPVKVLGIDDVNTAAMLDDKIMFLTECQNLGLPVPRFFRIQSSQDVFTLWERGLFTNSHFFLKPLNPYSEDRVCFTKIPDSLHDLSTFMEGYKHKISAHSPYFVSEYIKGDEYTGNVFCKNGEIYLYVSNPSSPMQIDYQSARDKTKIYDWVESFVRAKNLSGSLCFDFMEDPKTGEMMGIECNPRLHSSIVLMDEKREEAASAIFQALEGHPPSGFSLSKYERPVTPKVKATHVYWLYNELAKLVTSEAPAAAWRILRGKDAVWDSSDPLPFFLLPHLQLPSLLWDQLWRDQPWSIVNFCLGQLR